MDVHRIVEDLIADSYEAHADLESQVSRIARLVFEKTGTSKLALWMVGLATEDGPLEISSRSGAMQGGCAVRREGGFLAAEYPRFQAIRYAGREVGGLWMERTRLEAEVEKALVEKLAHSLALVRQRAAVDDAAARHFACPQRLVGSGAALRTLDLHIEKAAASRMPVLVRGEFGTEHAYVAWAVHYSGDRGDGPFVEVSCEGVEGGAEVLDPEEVVAAANGGSLFLNRLDRLGPKNQQIVRRMLTSRLGQWRGVRAEKSDVRVIATTCTDLRREVERGRFSRSLLAEISFLQLEIPPLRDRGDDLQHLVDFTIRKYQGTERGRLTDAAREICASYSWPENVFELERAFARLATMNADQDISLRVLREFTPRLFEGGPQRIGTEALKRPAPEPFSLPESEREIPLEELVRMVVEQDHSYEGRFHACLEKALRYLADHYAEDFTLPELARESCVSASHLSFLFRSNLGVTFKPLLGMVRIEHAKRLLIEERERRITDVSLDVGFGDLSHFEKMFKRHCEVNPREFRRQELFRRNTPARIDGGSDDRRGSSKEGIDLASMG